MTNNSVDDENVYICMCGGEIILVEMCFILEFQHSRMLLGVNNKDNTEII